MIFERLFTEGRSLMLNIAGRQQFPGGDWFHGSPDQDSVHDDVVADTQVSNSKFMLGGNILGELVDLIFEFDSLARFQIGEGDQDAVAGIELEHA